MYLISAQIPDGFARLAATRWGAEPDSVAHVGSSASAIYRCRRDGRTIYLRLTHPDLRTRAHLEDEVAFLRHLDGAGVPVAAPLDATDGAAVATLEVDDDLLFANAFEEAAGALVTPENPLWKPSFFRAWGESLRRIHDASRTFAPNARWHWREEDLIARAPELLAGDPASRAAFDEVMGRLADRPETDVGLIHGDFAPQNFRFDPARGITAFDFGNCCRHWYDADVAISLSTVRFRPDAEEIRGALLEGYGAAPRDLDDLIRLRVIYVLLSRLKAFGDAPEHAATIARMRAAVQERRGWV